VGYISGPTARNYIEENKFKAAGIELEWMRYEYPEYPQLYPPFEHGVSIVDTLFSVGKNYLKIYRKTNFKCDIIDNM
jgi:hypothetical protein